MADAAPPALPSLVSTSSMAVIVLFTVLATVAVGLRLGARRIAPTNDWLGADDYVIIVGLLFSWGLFATAIVVAAGAGINTLEGDALNDGTLILKIFFVEPLLEFPGQAFTRISVLLLYKRIFITNKVQWVCNIMIGIVSAWAFSAAITNLTGATPIWEAWSLTGHWNIDFGNFGIAIGAIGIAIDVVTLCIPIPVIHRLHMRLRTKILTACVLWLGLFCIVADSVRLYYTVAELGIAASDTGPDRYLVGRSVWLWDRIAPCSSIIAVCLPTYGPLLHTRKIESIIRSAGSWISFSRGSQDRDTSRAPGANETAGPDTKRQKSATTAGGIQRTATNDAGEAYKMHSISDRSSADKHNATADDTDVERQ